MVVLLNEYEVHRNTKCNFLVITTFVPGDGFYYENGSNKKNMCEMCGIQ